MALGLALGLAALMALQVAMARVDSHAQRRVGDKLSSGLWADVVGSRGSAMERIPVIVRVDKALHDRHMAMRRGAPSSNALDMVRSYRAFLTPREIRWLMESDEVEYISRDARITTAANPRNLTVGIDQQYGATRSKNLIGLNGKGIGVAVFDSGVADHPDLGGRFQVLVDFTSGKPVFYKDKTDAYGHGTHVAGIIAGGGRQSNGAFAGLATEADLVVLRVIGDDGTGWTSNLILAMEWAIQNRSKYNIRVANLSLGHPAFDPYWEDPLCQAAAKMVDAGIVTVVSAGNLGKTADYPEIWGAITSPGISPAVITVGAVNTFDTATHSDDVATTFSSRGPTIDGLMKPDLVAPGNRIVAPYSPKSRIAQQRPDLVLDDYYMELSGSSMAAASVSGAAALIVNAQPMLTPRMVKGLLMLSAVRMPHAHMLEQGNGMLNVLTAIELAKAADFKKRSFGSKVSPKWSLWGETVWAGGALAFGDQIVFSSMVDSNSNQFWGDGILWTESLFWTEGLLWADDVFSPDGLLWVDSSVGSDATLWVDGAFWCDGAFWIENVPWSDFFVGSSGLLWTAGGDQVEGDGGWDFGGDR